MASERLSKLQKAILQVLKIADEERTEMYKNIIKKGFGEELKIKDAYFQHLRSLNSFPIHMPGIKEMTWEWMKDMGDKGKAKFDCSFSRSVRNLLKKGYLEYRRAGRHIESVKRTEKATVLDYPKLFEKYSKC